MDEAIMSPEIAKLDLNKVAAIQQKRTLAFVNHFVVSTVQILNNFMKNCEQRLMHFQRKLEKVEAAVILLESKLSSIPEVNMETPRDAHPDEPNQEDVPIATVQHVENTNTENDELNKTEIKNDDPTPQVPPEYERFIKMVQVGVPLQAVKLKVSLEGLDPNILERLINK